MGATLTWIAGLGIITILLSVSLGSLLTYVVQTKTQRNAWKREIALRLTDELYGPLYVDIWNVLRSFSSRDTPQSVVVAYRFRSTLWQAITGDHRYRRIPQDLRKQLDAFYSLVDRTSAQWAGLINLGRRIVLEQTSQATGLNISVLNWVVRWTVPGQPTQEQAFSPEIALAGGEKIMDYVRSSYPGTDSWFFFLQVEHATSSGRTNVPFDDQSKVQTIFANMERAFEANQIVQEHTQNVQAIISTGKALRERLGVLVEQPWRT